MLDIPDAVGHEAGVAHARNGDPLAAQLHLLDLAREQLLDLDRDVGVGRTFEQRAHLFGGHAAGVLARDLDEAVADLQSGAVGREALVGLCDDHAVALLADQRPHAAVLAGGEELEIGHLLFGHVDRIGVEPPHHSFGGVGHQTVGVDLVDVVDRQFAHHVDQRLHVARQPEVVLRGKGQQGGRTEQGGRRQEIICDSFHCILFFRSRMSGDVAFETGCHARYRAPLTAQFDPLAELGDAHLVVEVQPQPPQRTGRPKGHALAVVVRRYEPLGPKGVHDPFAVVVEKSLHTPRDEPRKGIGCREEDDGRSEHPPPPRGEEQRGQLRRRHGQHTGQVHHQNHRCTQNAEVYEIFYGTNEAMHIDRLFG